MRFALSLSIDLIIKRENISLWAVVRTASRQPIDGFLSFVIMADLGRGVLMHLLFYPEHSLYDAHHHYLAYLCEKYLAVK
jgi:hypothetical protein